MRELWPHWPELRRALEEKSDLLVLLDFDGTLSALVDKPGAARFPASTRRCLRDLARRPRTSVAVVSGRALADVRRRVGLRSIYYGGNHGLEMSGPGLAFLFPKAEERRLMMKDLATDFKAGLSDVPGAFVEDKGLSLSVHFRRVPGGARPLFHGRVRRFKKKTAGLPVLWRKGLQVWELLPRAAWNKGRAVQHLGRWLGDPWPIAVGDDRTDEDMFRAVRGRGLAVRVGRGESAAPYHLESFEEVPRLLSELASLKGAFR